MQPEPLVLGFDTSFATCSAALVRGDDVLYEKHEPMARGQAERLFPLLEEILSEADQAWSDLDRIACGVGPGNFTGIRLSVSAARGLAMSLGVPAVGVSTFQALAYGHENSIVTTIDARRDQVYAQTFLQGQGGEMQVVDFNDLVSDLPADIVACVGYRAGDLAEIKGIEHFDPVATGLAVALIGAGADLSEVARPTPLYLKKPDAAPGRDKAPVLLS